MLHNKTIGLLILLGGLALSACAAPTQNATATPRPTCGGALTPFASATITVTPSPTDSSTATPLPSPTPTPITHTVIKGEDLFGIAMRYRISLDELKAANPTVQPNFLSIGTTLIIPPSKTPMPEPAAVPGGASPDANAVPTPLPLTLGQPNCLRSQEGGVWCFLPVSNPQSGPVEGISAVIRLAGSGTLAGSGELASSGEQTIVPVTAYPWLDILAPGATLPLAAYYPPESIAALAGPLQSSGELVSALPGVEDGRYLPVQIERPVMAIDPGGRSAKISLDVRLTASEGAAQRVWVLATAYNAQGEIIGARRWEKTSAEPLPSGQALAVEMEVYSVAGKIERVELAAEARP